MLSASLSLTAFFFFFFLFVVLLFFPSFGNLSGASRPFPSPYAAAAVYLTRSSSLSIDLLPRLLQSCPVLDLRPFPLFCPAHVFVSAPLLFFVIHAIPDRCTRHAGRQEKAGRQMSRGGRAEERGARRIPCLEQLRQRHHRGPL